MWASIGALVQNGQGNRYATTLNAIGVLYGHCRDQSPINMDPAFDSVIAQIVPDLDDATIEALADCSADFAGQFPQFSAIIQEHMARRNAVPAPIEVSSSTPFQNNSSDLETFASAPEPPIERRNRAREPITDENNPITLARRANVAELLQIAGLPNLPEALTNVLISRGDRMVIERALKNPSALFAKSSLTTLAELAPSDRMIKDALVERNDLPESIAERILPYLNQRAKARVLLSGAPFSAKDCEDALANAAQELASSVNQGQVMIGLDHCLTTMSEGQSSVSDVISILARDARVAELSAFAAQQLGVSQASTFNALSSRFDHAAGVILRALDSNAAAFNDAMDMRRRCGCREAKETKSAWMRSQRYSVDDAKALVQDFHDTIATQSAVAAQVEEHVYAEAVAA
jgi:Uncharacterised protein conserved in bacteria (DUF2336)